MLSFIRLAALAITAGLLANPQVNNNSLNTSPPRPPPPRPPNICSKLAVAANSLSISAYSAASNQQCLVGLAHCLECITPPATACLPIDLPANKTDTAGAPPLEMTLLGLPVPRLLSLVPVSIGLVAGSSVIPATAAPVKIFCSTFKAISLFYWWLANRTTIIIASALLIIWNKYLRRPVCLLLKASLLALVLRLAYHARILIGSLYGDSIRRWTFWFIFKFHDVFPLIYGSAFLFVLMVAIAYASFCALRSVARLVHRVLRFIGHIIIKALALAAFAARAFTKIALNAYTSSKPLASWTLIILTKAASSTSNLVHALAKWISSVLTTAASNLCALALALVDQVSVSLVNAALTIYALFNAFVGRTLAAFTKTTSNIHAALDHAVAQLTATCQISLEGALVYQHICVAVHLLALTSGVAVSLSSRAHLLGSYHRTTFFCQAISLLFASTVLVLGAHCLHALSPCLKKTWNTIKPRLHRIANTIIRRLPLPEFSQRDILLVFRSCIVHLKPWALNLQAALHRVFESPLVHAIAVSLFQVIARIAGIMDYYVGRPYSAPLKSIYQMAGDLMAANLYHYWNSISPLLRNWSPNTAIPDIQNVTYAGDDLATSGPPVCIHQGPLPYDTSLWGLPGFVWVSSTERKIFSSGIRLRRRYFRLMRGLIGTGDSAQVYRGLLTLHGEPTRVLALKVIHTGADDLVTYPVINEAHILSELKGAPGFVDFLGLYQNNYHLGLLLAAYPEGSLRNRLNSVKILPLDVVASFTSELIHSLRHLHRLGIIHRNIKPENILLENGRPIITGFGSAFLVDKDTIPTPPPILSLDFPPLDVVPRKAGAHAPTCVGTPGYMAPEVFNDKLCYSYGVDIFSLFCMTHELLVGELPQVDHRCRFVFRSRHLRQYPVAYALLREALRYDSRKRPRLSSIVEHPFFSPRSTDLTFTIPESSP
ncbi:hypothetical protein ONZ45_g18125 [Pleurotus djamor]|nr:hypothetical protein ONZ45_g18125 [Pleurotus djamor]